MFRDIMKIGIGTVMSRFLLYLAMSATFQWLGITGFLFSATNYIMDLLEEPASDLMASGWVSDGIAELFIPTPEGATPDEVGTFIQENAHGRLSPGIQIVEDGVVVSVNGSSKAEWMRRELDGWGIPCSDGAFVAVRNV